MTHGNGKPNSLVEWMAGQNMPKKKAKDLSLRSLLSASIDVVTDDTNQKDYIAVGFPHHSSPLRRLDRGKSSKKVAFSPSSLRRSVDALSLLADSSGGEFLSDYDSDDDVAPAKVAAKPRKSSFKQGKEKNTVDTDTSEGETGHGSHGMSPHPNCDCLICAAGRSLMRELGKGGSDHASVASTAKKGKASKIVESETTPGETTTAGETESEPQQPKAKKGKGGGGQANQQNQEKKDDGGGGGGGKKDSSNDAKDDNKKKEEAKKNENDNKKNNNENKKNENENKKDGDNTKKGDQAKGDQGKGDQGKQNNKQEAKGNPPTGNTPLPYKGSPDSRIILPVRQQTVHVEHAIEDTTKDHPPNAYMDFNRDVCRMYHGSEWGTHRKPHPSNNSAMPQHTPYQNMTSMYPMGSYIPGMPQMPPMYPPQQPGYQMVYPHHMYQPAYIPSAQHQSTNHQTAQAFAHPQMYVPQLHPSYGVYPPYSQPGAPFAQPGAPYAPPGVMWGAPPPVNPAPPVAVPAAPAAASSRTPTAAANAGLSGMSLSGLGVTGAGSGLSLSGLPNGGGGPPATPTTRANRTSDDTNDLYKKFIAEQRKKYPNGIPGLPGYNKPKTPTGSVRVPSKPPTENGVNGNDGAANGFHWDDSNGGNNENNNNNDNNGTNGDANNWNNDSTNNNDNNGNSWEAPAPDNNDNNGTSWDAPAPDNNDNTGDFWGDTAAPTTSWGDPPAEPRYDEPQLAGDPDTVHDNPSGHMPGSWNNWDNTQNGSHPGSPQGAADSGYYTVDPVPEDNNPPAWNGTTTSMLSSIGLRCRSTLSAAKQTIFGASSGDTGDENGETKDENGAAQGEWGDPAANQPAPNEW
ncbi:hypothetical protein QBC39DRAFT_419609 [Podospora conica]|nr:hypothetical protein QBC39DRAFT_419609 [Schizothecium conicum]